MSGITNNLAANKPDSRPGNS